MIVRHLLGVRQDIATAAKSGQLRASQITALLVIGAVVIDVLNPVPGLDSAPIATKLAFWIIVVSLFALSYVISELFLVQVGRRLGWTSVAELPISAAAVAVTAVILLNLTRAMTVPHITAFKALEVAFASLLLIQLLGLLFVGYLSGWVLREKTNGGSPETPRPPSTPSPVPEQPAIRVLFANGIRLLEPEVVAIVSQGQYVEVYLGRKSRLIRTSLKALVGQTGPEAGILINRGVWMSRGALSRLRRNRTSMWVEFEDGQRFYVARSRFAAVEALTAGLIEKAGRA